MRLGGFDGFRPNAMPNPIHMPIPTHTGPATVTCWFVTWLDEVAVKDKQSKANMTPSELEVDFYKKVARLANTNDVSLAITLRLSFLKQAKEHGFKPVRELLRMGTDINNVLEVYQRLAILRQGNPTLFKAGGKKRPYQHGGGRGGRGRGKGSHNRYNNYHQNNTTNSGKGGAPKGGADGARR